jgi:Flp pilus assembly protein TadG
MKRIFLLNRKFSALYRSSSGTVAVMTGILMTVFLGFTGLSIDLGHLALVKSELQRAADAGALAGARALAPYGENNGIVSSILWTTGENVAKSTAKSNKSDGVLLTDCVIESGFWNLTTKTLQDKNITPTAQDVPAVRVTINKISGQNGGAVQFFFGSFVGKESSNLTVQTMAALPGGPGSASPGGCWPLAAPETWVKNNWNNPASFKMYSDYHADNGGQWTSLMDEENNVPFIRGLMDEGNPDTVSIGDKIYIQPGTKAALYGYADAFIGKTVLIPVVADDFQTHNYTPVKGFVAFKIEDVNQGQKWIQGHFEKNYVAPATNTDPNAPFYGTYASSAKIVQ